MVVVAKTEWLLVQGAKDFLAEQEDGFFAVAERAQSVAVAYEWNEQGLTSRQDPQRRCCAGEASGSRL